MKGKKRGISSILGAIILIQIILLSLLLLITIQQKIGDISSDVMEKLNSYSQNSPISIVEIDGEFLLASTTPEYVCYVIYPNNYTPVHKVFKLPILLNLILNNYSWAIIVTNKGTWYNVSLPFDNLQGGVVTPAISNILGIPILGKIPICNILLPNWNYTRGVVTPDPFAIIPINYTLEIYENSEIYYINYKYAISNAIIKLSSNSQWINVTLTYPLEEELNNMPSEKRGNSSLSNIYVLLGIYLPIYNETNKYYSDGWIYIPILFNPYTLLTPYQLVNNFKLFIYSYYGNLTRSGVLANYHPANNPYYDQSICQPVLYQIDINPSTLTIYVYALYSESSNPINNVYIINNYKWIYLGEVKVYNAHILLGSPIYVVVPSETGIVSLYY